MIQPNSVDFRSYLQEKKPLVESKYVYGEQLFSKETIGLFR